MSNEVLFPLICIAAVGLGIFLGRHHPKKPIPRMALHVHIGGIAGSPFIRTKPIIFECYNKKCENCVLKFRCGTSRDYIDLTWTEWEDLKLKLKKIKQVKDF